MESALVPYASSALSNLLGQQATSAVTPLATKAVTDAASAGLGKLLGTQATKIAVQRNIDPLSALQSAYDDVVGFKKGQGINYESLNNKVFDYSPKYSGNRNAIASIIGENDTTGLENNLSGMLKMGIPGEQYDLARQKATDWLNSDASNSAAELSKQFIKPGTKIFRANNSPAGISWTLDRQTAQNAVQDNLPFVQSNRAAGLPDVLEYTVRPNDKIIAPQLTEFMNENPLAQGEVLFDFSTIEQPRISPEVQEYLGGYGGTGSFSKDIQRVGSNAVAAVNQDTLPQGWDTLKKYLDTSNKRVENAIGKSTSKITKQDLIKFNSEMGYDTEGTKAELWQAAKNAIDDETLDDLYMSGGSSAADVILSRKDRTDFAPVERVYMGAKGRTGRLDAELSDRLGIGRSNTPMLDTTNKYFGGAAGDYGGGAIGSDPTWSTGEAGVSNVAHERLHSIQEHARLQDYDPAVSEAFNDLEDELLPLFHSKEQIIAKHGAGDAAYWAERNEQEARMFQDYLEYKNYTQRYMGGKRNYEYGKEIIKPFDKFIKKLRELSKKGIALPSLALLFGGATLAAGAGDRKDES